MASAVAPRPYLLRDGEGEALWFLGNLVTVKAGGTATLGRLTLVEFVNPARFAPPLHRHRDEDELFYVLSGTASFRCDGEELGAGPGTGGRRGAGDHRRRLQHRDPRSAAQRMTIAAIAGFACLWPSVFGARPVRWCWSAARARPRVAGGQWSLAKNWRRSAMRRSGASWAAQWLPRS
jgi:hypothetical protein